MGTGGLNSPCPNCKGSTNHHAKLRTKPSDPLLQVTCSEVTKILKSAVQGCAVLLASQPRTVELPNYAAPIPVGCRLLRGIPQGSRFSPFLCALHMGAGDGRLPADVAESLGSGRSALVRLVDDFLYLSTEPGSCCNFLSCLAQEENPYQGDLNWQKCAGNFPFCCLESSQDPCFVPTSQRLPPSSTEVPWAGLTLAPAKGFLNIRQGTKRRVTDAMAVKKPKRGKLGKIKVWEQAGDDGGVGRVWELMVNGRIAIISHQVG